MTDNLDFQHHWERVSPHVEGVTNWDTIRLFTFQAHEDHALSIKDALNKIMPVALHAAQAASNQEAAYFLRHGVARRLGMIRVSFVELCAMVPPSRSEVMSLDDVGVTTRNLNVIYINIRGTLDCLTWSLLHELAPKAAERINPMSVHLFSKEVHKVLASERILATTSKMENWDRLMRERRNPSAHRIPLTVSPAAFDESSIEGYRALEARMATALEERDWDRWAALQKEQETLGRFLPFFLHHPEEDLTPIYPTVPQDIGSMVRLTTELCGHLINRDW